MKSTCLSGLHFWSEFQPDKRIDFNGFFIERERGHLLVDPMPLAPPQREFIEERGGVGFVLLTNADHLRAGIECAQEFGAQLLGPQPDRARFGEAAGAMSGWFGGTKDLPEDLAGGIEVHWLDGGKCEAEAALHLTDQRALLFGDAVRSHLTGRLRYLPEAKIADRAALQRSTAALAGLDFDAVLLGDGDCLFRGGQQALDELLRAGQ